MILVLLLAGVEKLINFAIQSDQITQAGLELLTGKVMRLNMQMPELHIDVLFNDSHLRFEPVISEPIFEANHINNPSDSRTPNCTVNVDNPVQLLNLIRSPEGNLPIEGDYQVLMQVRALMAGFDPDIIAQLEPFIGIALASQLTQVINHLKSTFSDTAKHTFNDVADWANEVTGYGGKPDSETQNDINDAYQQLLKLRTDIDREQARLDAIKQEQQRLQQP